MGKRKRKVKLPCDANGDPIHVGDWLIFSDGPFYVDALCWMGDECGWYATSDTGGEADNLGGGTIISLPKGDK